MSVPSIPKPQTLMKDHYQPAEQLDDRQFVEVVCVCVCVCVGGGGGGREQ